MGDQSRQISALYHKQLRSNREKTIWGWHPPRQERVNHGARIRSMTAGVCPPLINTLPNPCGLEFGAAYLPSYSILLHK